MARNLSGNNANYLSLADIQAIKGNRPMSVSCWIKRDAAGENDYMFWKRGDPNNGWGFDITDNNVLDFVFFGVAGILSSVTFGTSTDWQHTGVTVSASGTVTFYKNGLQLGDTAGIGSPKLTSVPLLIGVRTNEEVIDGNSDYDICEIGIWQSELRAGQMRALGIGRVSPSRVDSTNGVFWPLWGTHSPEIDLSPNNLPLVINGTVASATHAPVIPFTPKWAATNPLIEVAPAGGGIRNPFGGPMVLRNPLGA